ncbi:IMPACT family protein [Bifidobacterium sp.]|jgi:uncharacterized YigZ family protein|uniref:IMPACT family protein n=1 Tax=Bifidobacterium sp. TaxID=41200 RepID=UPI0025BC0B31|nr:YigZ family protein [Bifidobacterium sp.]MCH4209024.1 IMPACT family protein [Bifidobacterium sp.]MCI1225045.1 IMPACT family protein [Bifidobacterium sp.]
MAENMGRTVLNAPNDPAHDAFVERRSQFIGDACHITAFGEALAFVGSIRSRHPKARHVAYACVCGGAGQLSGRMSDDGEPSGTAGKPILEVLTGNGLTDCVVTVTRYFGGVLLGAGGLIRAYSTAASMAIAKARFGVLRRSRRYRVVLDYRHIGALQRILAALGGEQGETRYADRVTFELLLPEEHAERFEAQVRDAFSGAVRPEAVGAAEQIIEA